MAQKAFFLYNILMSNQSDRDEQNKNIEDFRKREEEALMQLLSVEKYNIPYINLATIAIDNEALRYVSEAEARNAEVAPFKTSGKKLLIAAHAPSRSEVAVILDSIKRKNMEPELYIASRASLERVWERYTELSNATSSATGSVEISGDVIVELGQSIKTIADIKSKINDAGKDSIHFTSHVLQTILAGAMKLSASDIHIEPSETDLTIRYRLDGVLQEAVVLPIKFFHLISSRIKLISGVKITNNNIAQDGRFSIFINAEEISVRVSLIPGAYGESIVMRLLNPKSIRVGMEELGIPDNLFKLIDSEIHKPNGMILLTGPTGSGKTTSLYSFLQRIYSKEVKIITIEDPVEYHLPGITQTQADNEAGYTFANGLRSALRQDPEVIMVGEIRDHETAEIAIEAALTGHIVFSTLHTNNAAGVIPRFIDLGVNPKILVSALSLSIAQRLVRKLCTKCSTVKQADANEVKDINMILDGATKNGKDLSSYKIERKESYEIGVAHGCEECNFTGYKGRFGIFEAIYNDESIQAIIPNNPSEHEIKMVADKQGILDMREDGIVKVINKITTLEEVKSVVSLTD
jgi:type IV pilus assembly protein PilB